VSPHDVCFDGASENLGEGILSHTRCMHIVMFRQHCSMHQTIQRLEGKKFGNPHQFENCNNVRTYSIIKTETKAF